jgi:hypothetical protein
VGSGFAFPGGVPLVRTVPAVVIAVVLFAARAAAAQAPGVHPVRQHAEPPLPQALPSPMPSLPPPLAKAPGETSPIGAPLFGSSVIVRPGYSARVGADGSIDFGERLIHDSDLLDPVRGIGPVFSIDATDIILRLLGDDPYLSDKLAVMDATRAERLEIRRAHDEDRMERALADLPAYLDAIWNQRSWPASTRRRVLFVLWDESAEEGNALVVEGGERARAEIARFIAARLPPGDSNGFTDRELAALNRARTSRAVFAPYRGRSDAIDPSDMVVAAGTGLQVTRLLAAF